MDLVTVFGCAGDSSSLSGKEWNAQRVPATKDRITERVKPNCSEISSSGVEGRVKRVIFNQRVLNSGRLHRLLTGERTTVREGAVRDTAIQKTMFFSKQVKVQHCLLRL